METNVVIQNFRCFEKIKISDLARVNLIGGKNNAGKTSLLEALLLSNNPYLSTIIFLNKYIRKESQKFYESMLTEVWSSLFLKKEHKIYLLGKYDNGNERSITISLNNIFLELEFSIFDPLHNLLENQNENISRGDYLRIISERSLNNTLTFIDSHNLPMIPSFSIISSKDLTMEFDKARLAEKDEELLKAFQILDPAIIKVESFSIGEPNLYISKHNEKRLPLSLFGDAINRIANIILKLINNDSQILLIDEIENGIHYTNQRQFWRLLFRLAIELDVQIFATTHSGEMIKAFADVCLENYQDKGAYFELTRKAKTNQIIAIKRDAETLNYALEHNRGVRGE